MADGLADRAAHAVEGLTPGYFALVMATGVISVGMHPEDFDVLSGLLLVVCAAAFVVLLGLTLWRFTAYRSAVVEDFTDPRRGFGFFTFVAGTNVLGVRLGLEGAHPATANEFGPEELTPPYWVSMGALAITVLAGARIVEMQTPRWRGDHRSGRAVGGVRGVADGLRGHGPQRRHHRVGRRPPHRGETRGLTTGALPSRAERSRRSPVGLASRSCCTEWVRTPGRRTEAPWRPDTGLSPLRVGVRGG